jgi:D-alanyl-D-alanine carboxypeptidase (penicillin-binding protein 5/6)
VVIVALLVVSLAVTVRPHQTPRQLTIRPVAHPAGASRPGTSPATDDPPAFLSPIKSPPLPVLPEDWLAFHPSPDLGIHSESALLVDVGTREVQWARGEHDSRPPASLAKLMTAMVAADLATSLDQPVTVPAAVGRLESDSTFMGVSPGEVLTVRELMYGMFMVSGNDAAETLAYAFGDPDHFVDLMNQKAAALGMRDSHFSNPTGLDDPGLRTSAYDLAVAATTIVTRYPNVLVAAGAKQMVLPATANHKGFFLNTFIKLIGTYPGATGLKTGYTDDAGYCLVGTATRGDRTLVVVLLQGDLALTADAVKLLDYGFSLPKPVPFDPSGTPEIQ